MTTPDAIVHAALQLPEAERWVIVDKLLESLPAAPSAQDLNDPEFIQEMDRRAADLTGSMEWSQIRDLE
jgi:hypothetical protein